MRNKITSVLFCLMISLSLPAWTASRNSDTIVAIVNDEVITFKDLKDYMANIYSQLRIENNDPFEVNEIMRQYEQKGINQLIEDKLILAASKEKEIVVKDAAIIKKIEEIKSRYPSELVFQTMLDQQGMTMSDLRDRIADQMRAKFMVDHEVRSKIFVNPQEVTDYYNQHQDEFVRKARVNLDSIFISFEKGLEDARKAAGLVHAKLKEGKDFSEASKEYSDLPSVGVIEEGQLKPDIEKKVFNMKEDEISDPIEVENGIYIFRFVNKSKRETRSLNDVKETIHNKIFEQKFQDRFSSWIEKLRKKAYVEIRS
ncbi:MAG: peptidyl-prolyl cis-trans isomerase [Alphaproteobacteria bacterium]|nr:peptidyl-prolyl cis-trans isomerase [Alphaproteobacteria bacterium]